MPSVGSYVALMENPEMWFSTLGDALPVRDDEQRAIFYAGNSAVAFKVMLRGQLKMLRCFTKLSERRREIYSFLAQADSPLVGNIQLLERELYVAPAEGDGEYADVVISDWIEGMSLRSAIDKACQSGNKATLTRLYERFKTLSLSLLSQTWAHGDMKPENIMVDTDGELHLIDFDAVYTPNSVHNTAIEVGTKSFQHPSRNSNCYDKHIDDYPIVLLCAMLDILAECPERYCDICEGHTLYPSSIFGGDNQEFNILKSQAAQRGNVGRYRLLDALTSPTHVIDNLLDILTKPYFDCIGQPHESLSIAELGSSYHFVDSRLSIAINASYWDEVGNFSHSLAAVRRGDKWGYIDTEGRVSIEPCFRRASSFRCGVALVQQGELYGFITPTGVWHIEPKYHYATSFRDDVATVELDKKLFTINKKGIVVG